ncbi:MAG: hypothetical protein ACOX8H_01460 [Ruminococcus sp.]|jgi:hypothetical protein
MLWHGISNCQLIKKRKNNSLQAYHYMFPPAQHDTSRARVSSCISSAKASLTAEAVVALPLFFIMTVILISLIDLVRVYSEVTVSLNESAKKLGMYAYVSERAPESSPVGIVGTGVCIGYAQSQLPREERVSVSCTASSYRNNTVDLRARVIYRFPVSFAGIKQAVFPVRAVVHAWTGYQGTAAEGITGTSEEMVYVTERQTVYHTHSDCSHMNVTVYCVTKKEGKSRRNDYGQKYEACSHCKEYGDSDTVYLTPKGDSYHFSAECSALKRTVQLIKKSEAASLQECSRCRGRG